MAPQQLTGDHEVLHVSALQQLVQQSTQQLRGEGQLQMTIAHLHRGRGSSGGGEGGSFNTSIVAKIELQILLHV